MEDIEQHSCSYYRLHEKIALISLLNKEMKNHSILDKFSGIKSFIATVFNYSLFYLANLSCITSEARALKEQRNTNNNNNKDISSHPTGEPNVLLQFYVFDVSDERNLRLSTCSSDKRLLIFCNTSNGLYKKGLRNGEFI